ncbi:MAG TPA: tetratricopeptide repeat protein [Polyangiaceae bacterium]
MTDEERPSAFYGASSLGLTLFSAGRDERPSDEALARTLAALGAGAAVVAVTSGVAGAGLTASTVAKSSATLVSFGSVMKWLGMGAVGGFVVAGVTHGVAPLERTSLELPPPVHVAAPPALPAAERPKLDEKSVRAAAEENDGDAQKSLAPPPAPARAVDDVEERRAPLAAEVELVDRARAALGSGNPGRALEALSGYEKAFPDPRLLPEVLYLRLESHLAAGDVDRARAVAEESIRRFPRSPHAARARQVLEDDVGKKK